jgi:alkylated DNA repair dioxygenase AlkB
MDAPKGVLCFDNVIPRALAEQAFQYIDTTELVWYGPQSKTGVVKKKKSRVSFGRHEGVDPDLPPVFEEIGRRAIEAVRSRVPIEQREEVHALLSDANAATCILNMYDPGDGIAPHNDPARRNPMVLGVTMCEVATTTRKMRFHKCKDKTKKHTVITRDCSAYLFWGDGYSDWKHESVKSKLQRGRVLSASFRAKRVV